MPNLVYRQVAPRRVNVLDPDLPSPRLVALRDAYRRRLDRSGPGDPPAWYAARVVAAAESILAARTGAA